MRAGHEEAVSQVREEMQPALEGPVLKSGAQALQCDPPLALAGLKLLAAVLAMQPASVRTLSRCLPCLSSAQAPCLDAADFEADLPDLRS